MTSIKKLLPDGRKTLIIPIDHGLAMGNIAGLEQPEQVLRALIQGGVDGTLMSVGFARRLGGLCRDHGLSLTLTLDFQLLGARPGEWGAVRGLTEVTSVRQAKEIGADAVKLLFVWGIGDELALQNVRMVAKAAEEAHLLDLPLMVEPLWLGAPLSEGELDDFVVHASRIAVELGADILKIPVVGVAAVKQILPWGIPIVFLGGVLQDDSTALFARVKAGLAAGVRGLVIGRNIWQRPRMAEALEELRARVL